MLKTISAASKATRFHAFDTLRATMMLLGLVLHTASNYGKLGTYSYRDPVVSVAGDTLVAVIHLFRMPVFFIMAGFFTGLLAERRGASGMLRNRFRRVTLVLFVAWLVIIPLTTLSLEFARGQAANGAGFARAMESAVPHVLWGNNTMHLWFLWYLTLYYLVIAAAKQVAGYVGEQRMTPLYRIAKGILFNPLCALLLALPLSGTIYFQSGWVVTDNAFIPSRAVFALYFAFFGVGFASWNFPDILDVWRRRSAAHLSAGLVIMLIALRDFQLLPQTTSLMSRGVEAFMVGLAMSLLAFGICGVALRFASRESKGMRYMTDASYWIYIVHLPIVFVLSGLFAQVALPAMIKMTLVIVATFALTVVTYHYWVRSTFIGVFLNGARYSTAETALDARPQKAA